MDEGQGRKKFGPKLEASTSTLPGPLSLGPPGPGPGYDVPPEPPLAGPASETDVHRCAQLCWYYLCVCMSVFTRVLYVGSCRLDDRHGLLRASISSAIGV